MKDDQKLFDLFRDNEHKLHEYPSADAWRRLEQRLDAHRQRRRIFPLSPFSMAASLVLLIGLVGLFAWITQGIQKEDPAGSAHFAVLEDLPLPSGPDFYSQNLNAGRQYAQATLDEGSSQKRFRVNQPRQAPEPVVAFRKSKDANSIATGPQTKPMTQAGEGDDLALLDEARESKVVADEQPGTSYPPPAAREKAMAEDAASTARSGPEMPFDWLIGTWRGNDKGVDIYEEWSYLNEGQLRGVTYTMKGNKKKVVEESEIRNDKGVWNYVAPAQGYSQNNSYPLQSIDSDQAVFSNAIPDQPQQVILQRNGDREYSTILQYEAKTDSLVRIENQQAVRKMRRVGN